MNNPEENSYISDHPADKLIPNCLVTKGEVAKLAVNLDKGRGPIKFTAEEIMRIINEIHNARLIEESFQMMLAGRIYLDLNDEGEFQSLETNETQQIDLLENYQKIEQGFLEGAFDEENEN